MQKLTRKELTSLLDIDPENGILTWKKRDLSQIKSGNYSALQMWNKKLAGKEAGSISSNGYRVIEIHDKAYKAHRLVWFFVNGFMPEFIDHIDGDKLNNSIGNLRSVDLVQNARNATLQKNNKSGVSGVSFSNADGLWHVTIGAGRGRVIKLGSLKDKFEAVAIRKSAELRLGYHKNHGRKPCAG